MASNIVYFWWMLLSSGIYQHHVNANYSLIGSHEFAILGQPFTWTCKTFGVKPSEASILGIRWTRGLVNSNESYTGEKHVATVGVLDNKCLLDGNISTKYIYNCTNDGNFILTIPAQNMTLEEQHTWWRCRYYTELDSSIYGSNFQQLSIHVPVRELQLSSSSIIVEEGAKVTLSCRVNNGSNPVPILQWSLEGRNLTSTSVVDVNTPYISILTYTGSRMDQNKTIICMAQNTPFQARATLAILYAPTTRDNLTLSSSRQQPLYYGDHDFGVTCLQPGGYPLCNLTLLCQEQHGTDQSSYDVAASHLVISITKKLNGKYCTCQATHNVGSFSRHKELYFVVYYSPDKPIIKSFPPFPWKSGYSGTLSCVTGNGNPDNYTYRWTEKNSTIIDTHNLTIATLTPSDNSRAFKCSVDNAYTLHRGTSLESNYIKLQVEFDPIIIEIGTDITSEEGQSVVRNCSAIGYPTPQVTWIHEEMTKTIASGRSWCLLNLKNINRTDTGNYTCVAVPISPVNHLDNASRTISLIVQYPPDVAVVIRNKTEGHQNVSIRCKPQGSPTVYHFHGWEHYFMGRKVRNVQDLQEYTHAGELLLPTVTYQDQGTYVCLVDNGIKGRSESVVQRGRGYLDVKASLNIYVGRFNNDLNISVPVYSNPLPTRQTHLIWINKNKAVTIPYAQDSINISPTDVKIQFFTTNILVEGVLATWTIKEFTEEYIGNYSLIVNNGIEEKTFDFRLDVADAPKAPTDFAAVQIGTNSVIFHWIKGFNGGYPQTFHIIFNDSRSNSSHTWKYSDGKTITQTITGLKPSTMYSFWLFSQNKVGRSAYAAESPLNLHTHASSNDKEKVDNKTFSVTSYIGGAFSIILVVLFILIILYIVRRRRTQEAHKAEDSRVYDSLGERNRDKDIYNDLNMTDNPQSTSEDQQEGQSVYVNTAITGE